MQSAEHYMGEAKAALLRKQHYEVFGHSAVKVCHWTKKALTEKKFCYKNTFYGIQSHRCVQMTPSVAWCQHLCNFCWRPLIYAPGSLKEDNVDSPDEIVDGSIKAHLKKLSGFGAQREDIGERMFEQMLDPTHVAISLSGEPTLYPKLSALIKEYKKKKISTFVVSNGMNPDLLEQMEPPTQLYISLETPTKELQEKINRSREDKAWEKLNRTIELLPKLKTRTVIRVTAIKGQNMDCPELFAQMIAKGQPDFIEVKAYMFVGSSRVRMKEDNMPSHAEVKAFGQQIAEHLGYDFRKESEPSRVVLLTHPRWRDKSTIINFERL